MIKPFPEDFKNFDVNYVAEPKYESTKEDAELSWHLLWPFDGERVVVYGDEEWIFLFDLTREDFQYAVQQLYAQEIFGKEAA